MAYTRTSTFTTRYSIGDELARKYPELKPAYEAMKKYTNENQEKLEARGLKIKQTDDFSEYELIRFQWERVPEIAKLLPKKLNE